MLDMLTNCYTTIPVLSKIKLPLFNSLSCFTFLQGINFQLAAVLISIGTYAYIEHGEWLLISIHLYKFVGGTMASTLEQALARSSDIKMCLANFIILSRGIRNAPSCRVPDVANWRGLASEFASLTKVGQRFNKIYWVTGWAARTSLTVKTRNE